jgi:DNA-binding transcriptional MerR regulator
VRFLRAIKEAQAVGFTLAEIAEYLRASRRSAAPSETLRVRMAAKVDEIDDRIGALRRMREGLARVVGCACSSLDHCTCGAAFLARRGKEPAMRPRLLHITSGESAGNTLRQTALGGAVLPWQDTLHEGPIPALPRKELLRTRARFLADCGWGRQQALLSSLERRDQQLLDAVHDDAHVVLWFEHDLYDQLQLLDVLTLAHTAEAAPELIVIGSFPGKPASAGLGELTARELETLWPSRRPTEPAALETAAAAWAALQAPEPYGTGRVGNTEDHSAAVSRARAATAARRTARLHERTLAHRTARPGSNRRRRPDTPGRLRRRTTTRGRPLPRRHLVLPSFSALGQGANRLLETDHGTQLPAPPPLSDNQLFARLPLQLTPTGERTLRGKGDRVELLGIDRWIGGTHLTPDNTWRWHPTNQKLVPPPRP